MSDEIMNKPSEEITEQTENTGAVTEETAAETTTENAESEEAAPAPVLSADAKAAADARALVRERAEARAAAAEADDVPEPEFIGHGKVTNWQIIKNFAHYTSEERRHYNYIFWRRIGSVVWPIFRMLIIFGLSFVIMYPILYMISCSLRPQVEMQDPSVMWIPKTLRFQNFKDVWTTIDYPHVLWTTIELNIVASVLQVGSCALTGYGFARFKFKGKKFMFAIVLLQIIVPPQILIMPQYNLFRNFDLFGLVNAFTGAPVSLINTNYTMYIPAIFGNGIRGGLFIYLFRQFFRGLPKELEDAAYLDGCGPFKTFISVMVPNAASSFLTVFIFSIVWYWNDFYYSAMFFTNSQTMSLQVSNLANTMSVALTGEIGLASRFMTWVEAGCLMAILPIIIMYVFLQKYFTEGIERAGLAN